jgi:hypothetical protein
MTPEEILERAMVAGVSVALSSTGTVRVTGDQAAVDRWLPTIREHKPNILNELHRERRRAEVLALLNASPGTRYAVYVEDASTDPVLVAVGVRDIAAFEMEIPQKYYDGIELLELIEKQSDEQRANT